MIEIDKSFETKIGAYHSIRDIENVTSCIEYGIPLMFVFVAY